VPITRLTALERNSARLEGERSQSSGMIAQSKGKITEIELQIIQTDQNLRTEVGKDLIEARSKLSELTERKTAAVDQLNRIDIRAPQSGRVHQLSVHTVGGGSAPGEQIMLIVPDADALAVEVKIAPRDIDQMYVGQTATMRFADFNQKTTPEIDGEVSVDAYYTTRVLLKPEELASSVRPSWCLACRSKSLSRRIREPRCPICSSLFEGSGAARIQGAMTLEWHRSTRAR
jgi:HlyD family secretion protein